MKKVLLFPLFLLALFFIKSCAAQNANLNRQWMLIEFKNFSKEELTANKANIDFSPTKNNSNQYGAFTGCNRMFFTAKWINGGKIEFSGIGSTMMYCEKSMKLESEFGTALPKITHYKVDGHYLILSDDEGNKMKFVAADWD